MKKGAVNVSDVKCVNLHEGLDRKGFKNPVFSFLTDEDAVLYQDPCHRYVPIEDLSDPTNLEDYLEILPEEVEFEEVAPVTCPEILEFTECDLCGNHYGRISVASVNVERGVIFFQKEEDFVSDDLEIIDDEIFLENNFRLSRFQHKMNLIKDCYLRHRKGEQRKDQRKNRKTIPLKKIQRANRFVLNQIKLSPIEEESFYEVAALISQSIMDFLFTSQETDFYEELDEVYA